jgi:limonene-1,2-epoxide hydrolase
VLHPERCFATAVRRPRPLMCEGEVHVDRKKLVEQFFASWRTLDPATIVSHFAEDGVYNNIPMKPDLGYAVGRDKILQLIEPWMDHMRAGLDFEFRHLVSEGDTVLFERYDVLSRPDGAKVRLPIMGVMEFRGDLIAEWREYFDNEMLMSLAGPPEPT